MVEQIPIGLRVSLDAQETESVLVRFLKDYAADAARPRFVLGISGGLDSAVSGALAVRAVGAKNVYGLILPDAATPPNELADAELVARWLGIEHRRIALDGFLAAFGAVQPTGDRLVVGNAKARFRMVLLHAEAASRAALVLGTGNKSEVLVGYFSKFGDGGVDVQPIGDLYKTQVRLLARHLAVPEPIIVKAPTAGLWHGQTDEGELGLSYEVLDRILLGLELCIPVAEIARTVEVPASEVQRIDSLHRHSQHKRRMPMIPKIGLRTPGMDWRAATLEAAHE